LRPDSDNGDLREHLCEDGVWTVEPTPRPTPTPTLRPPDDAIVNISGDVTMKLTSDDFDKMKANPTVALEGLTVGLRAYFGVETVVITDTDPDLLSRQLDALRADARILSDTIDFLVGYVVTGEFGKIGDKAKSLEDNDPVSHGALADLMTSSLKTRGIEVEVQSSFPTPMPTPVPSSPPTLPTQTERDVSLGGVNPLAIAAIFVVIVLVVGAVGFFAYETNLKAKQALYQSKADDEAARLVEEQEKREDPNPVEHRHKHRSDFAEEAGGIETTQIQSVVADVQPVHLAPESPAANLLVTSTVDEEAYSVDPTGGAVRDAGGGGGGIAGFFGGFFCNACEATERQDEYRLSSPTTDGVAVRVT
jgi:hypothetical protein